MTSPLTKTQRIDSGSTLVLVLVISVLLLGILAVSLSTSDFSGTLSTQYGNTSQAALAAQSGLAVELSALRNVTVYTAFPCGTFSGTLSAPGATSSYSATVTYYPSGTNPAALTCSGSTLGGSTTPATATIVSTGTAPHGSPTTMQENIAIATTSTPSAALGYALFTSNPLDLTGSATVNSSGSNIANVYSGGTLTCGTGDSIAGAVTTYGTVDFTGTCSIAGLIASGAVTLANSAIVNGNVISYAGPLALSGSAEITGNATETNGNITLTGSGEIVGNAYASGTITVGSGSIKGTQTGLDTSLSSETMPAGISFPTLNPSVATWQGQGWNVIQIPGTVNGTSYSCLNATGGTLGTGANYFQSNSSGAADPYQTAIAALTTKTVFYAPTCVLSYSRTQTFNFAADTVLQVASLTTVGSDTYQSTSTTTHHDFSVLASAGSVCSTANVDVSVSNSSDFDSSLSTFIYTPGEVSYANSPSMTGQIVACGGITGSNSFTLTFDPSASGEIPGSSTATAPSVTVLNKFVG